MKIITMTSSSWPGGSCRQWRGGVRKGTYNMFRNLIIRLVANSLSLQCHFCQYLSSSLSEYLNLLTPWSRRVVFPAVMLECLGKLKFTWPYLVCCLKFSPVSRMKNFHKFSMLNLKNQVISMRAIIWNSHYQWHFR